MCVLPSALPCQVSTASPSVPSTSCSEKSTIIVVPPASAAAVPVSQSSAVTVPPNGMSLCVWPSMKPRITRAPETSPPPAPAGRGGSPAAGGSALALGPIPPPVRLATLVAPVPSRHPSALAKPATTADHVSGGRVDVGIGAGWHEREHAAYGFAFPPV